MSEDERKSTILEHLGELRWRLTRSVIAVVITTVISFTFYKQIFEILLSPTQGIDLIYTEMTEMISVVMRVCLASGIILAMPYLTYEFVMFVSPALTRKEKRYVYLGLPWVASMFLAGIAFSYFILVPRMTEFLITFGTDIARPQIRIENYISVVTRLLLAVGLVFEIPVLTTFLARLGVVSPKWLADRRKAAFILAFVLAAIITPTVDPINQSLVALPLVVLYEMSVWLAKLVYRRERRPAATPASSPVD